MEIWKCNQILIDNSFSFASIQSNISIHGSNGKSSKFIRSSHRLCSCKNWGYSSPTNCHWVKNSFHFLDRWQRHIYMCFSCVILTMCVPNMEYQLVNPTTQVALFALCVGNCSTTRKIKWNIYYGSINTSSNFTKWTSFNQTTAYENIWFFGNYSTVSNQLFQESFQESIQVILPQQIKYFYSILRFIFGDLKLFTHLSQKQV